VAGGANGVCNNEYRVDTKRVPNLLALVDMKEFYLGNFGNILVRKRHFPKTNQPHSLKVIRYLRK